MAYPFDQARLNEVAETQRDDKDAEEVQRCDCERSEFTLLIDVRPLGSQSRRVDFHVVKCELGNHETRHGDETSHLVCKQSKGGEGDLCL